MKITMPLKAIPILVPAIYAMIRAFPAGRTKPPTRQDHMPQMSNVLRGTVQKLMTDRQFTYAQIQVTKGCHWIALYSGVPIIGQEIECSIERSLEAYESKSLAMAFEKVYFEEGFIQISNDEAEMS